MRLTPTELDRLTIFTAAELARRRRARGWKLNHPEALAIICDEMQSIDNINTLAPLLPHAYAPVPRPSRPQPRTPPPRWSRRHSTEMRPAAIALVRSLKIREK